MKTSEFNKPFRTFFRKRRMRDFESLFHVADSDNVIDIGGTEFNWQFLKAEPHVVLVNIGGENWERGRFKRISGDGTRIGFPDRNFDIAYSNSVIEHVGDWQAMQRFAEEVKRLAPRYYVQTPNRYFFVEPHLIAPFIHWLPMALQRRLVPHQRKGFRRLYPAGAPVGRLSEREGRLTKKDRREPGLFI